MLQDSDIATLTDSQLTALYCEACAQSSRLYSARMSTVDLDADIDLLIVAMCDRQIS